MKVGIARQIAMEWVFKHVSGDTDNYVGALFSGSSIWFENDTRLPDHSDIDIMIITKQNEQPKLGKFVYKGVLLDVTYISCDQIASASKILSSYHLATSFRINTIFFDPTSNLNKIQKKVALHFKEEEWVRLRCEDVFQKITKGIEQVDHQSPLQAKIIQWLFSTGVTTHAPLVASLHNPTVRRRYVSLHDVLMEFGYAHLYMEFLNLIGCTNITKNRVKHHLVKLTQTFDTTVKFAKTPFNFSTDIKAYSKHIAIDGSYKLIEDGFHREAIFWIVATFSRCHIILAEDAPVEVREELCPAFRIILQDLGINNEQDLFQRMKDTMSYIPRLREITNKIINSNQQIIKK